MRNILLLLAGWLLAAPLLARAAPSAPPAFLLLDPTAMAAYKAAYRAGNSLQKSIVSDVLRQADRALAHAPYTIATKPQVPPSGDKHDYLSQAPYWWPDPSKPSGLPYIQKDGLHNPEAEAMHDSEQLSKLCADVQALSLAYYFSAEERYARQAARQLRGFFLAPATRMNPNLNFGQGIPGINTGRNFGIIETRHLVVVPEALALLSGSPSLDASLVTGLKTWFKDFNNWLLTSPIALPEGQARNNHGTFYDAQVVDFALFTGDEALARRTLQQQTWPRVAEQLAPDGAQPLELARTRPWNYVSMNLQGWVRLALLAPHVGLDLWHYTTPDGRGLRAAVAWFRPYLLGQQTMAKADAAPTSNTLALAAYEQASRAYPDLNAAAVFTKHPDFRPVPWAF
ncbi:alginate lyase family protein [Hymenobacter sp. H14-R3]|uniref:alginate lyase family protein n=1 Tax=Hymenobacter sp. H14-R3 TaxID=3046308 RepID=UPI0024BBE679|nr:alginate lyase family protein [Hymenobacter sp. H14-R3]MDJ0364425.1 alginate lyase family protein [Hymenobacter sp. H14-R3]